MMNAVQIQTRVLPGKRVEVETPDLEVGELVDVRIMPAKAISPNDLPIEERKRRLEEWINMPRENYPRLGEHAFHREFYYEDEE